MLSGRYVKTFAEASHALPAGMNMNADYPFMLPRIVAVDGKRITIQGKNGLGTAQIQQGPRGEYFSLAQSSTFESLYRQKPTTFTFHPFKDESTPAVAPPAQTLFDESRPT